MEEVKEEDNATTLPVTKLPRGGHVVDTCIGPVEFGMPPETIKDHMIMGLAIPAYYVVPTERFNSEIGPNEGINLAEFEFPAYCNFFFKGKQVNLIVNSEEVRERIENVFQETLLGPREINADEDFEKSYPKDDRANLVKELGYFRKFGDRLISVGMLLNFLVMENNEVVIHGDGDFEGKSVKVKMTPSRYLVSNVDSEDDDVAEVPLSVELPSPDPEKPLKEVFAAPLFGVTVLGGSHGFDPTGATSGYVVWINRRGIMVDPPPNSSRLLHRNNIPPSLIDGVIVTHCHADHDAGTLQKILQEGKIAVMTTPTILKSFVRKYAALTGLTEKFLMGGFQFRPVRIGEALKLRGGVFKFFYSLHSIPCIGFEVFFGDKSMVFSADHMNDPEKIKSLCEEGVLSEGRRDQLLSFPWHHDVILHEAGVPPIHTPMDTLANLPDDVKERLYIVHTAKNKIPVDKGLKGAEPGVENTIVLDVEAPENAGAIEILDLVNSIDLFSNLSIKHARDVLTIAIRQEFKAGDPVILKGDVGDCFYVIQYGVAEVRVDIVRVSGGSGAPCEGKEGESGTVRRPTVYRASDDVKKSNSRGQRSTLSESAKKSMTVKMYSTGDYFGEQALLNESSIRTADIYAVTDLSVIRFNRQDFYWLLQGTGVLERMQHLVEMRKNSVWETIGKNKTLTRLSASQKTQLENAFEMRETEAGEVLWREGEIADMCVLIDSGELQYEVKDGDSIGMPDQFSRGDFVGDIDALLGVKGNSFDLRVKTGGKILVMTREDLQRFFSSNPGVLLSLLHTFYLH